MDEDACGQLGWAEESPLAPLCVAFNQANLRSCEGTCVRASVASSNMRRWAMVGGLKLPHANSTTGCLDAPSLHSQQGPDDNTAV